MHVFYGHAFIWRQMRRQEPKKEHIKMMTVLTSGKERGKGLGLAGRVSGN